jgi:hypothetical protein
VAEAVIFVALFFGEKTSSQIFSASGPDSLMIEIAPVPGGVAMAQMVS